MLTIEQIQFLLEQLHYVTLYENTGLRLQEKHAGWADPSQKDGKMRGTCQAALSIMLEAASRVRERRGG